MNEAFSYGEDCVNLTFTADTAAQLYLQATASRLPQIYLECIIR
jgi:hypothetical protein